MVNYNKSSPAMEYLLGELKSNPRLSFEDLRERADLNSLHISRIHYGRAKALLGLSEATAEDEGTEVAFPTDDQWEDQQQEPGVEPGEPATPPQRAPATAPSPSPARKGRPLGSAMMFALDQLQMNPEASNKDILARAQLEGVSVTPNTLSLARRRLGLSKATRSVRKAKSKVTAADDATSAQPQPQANPPRTRPSRPATSTRQPRPAQPDSSSSRLDQLDRLISALKRDQEEAEHLEKTILQVIAVLQEALSNQRRDPLS